MKLLLFPFGIPVRKLPHRKEVRTAIYGWRLQSKRVDPLFPKPFRILKITQNHFSHKKADISIEMSAFLFIPPHESPGGNHT